MLVMDYLLAHVDRRSIEIQGLLNGNNRAINTRAVSAWRS